MTGTIEDVLQGNPDVVLIALPGGVVEMVALMEMHVRKLSN
jgi:hypothetical protein